MLLLASCSDPNDAGDARGALQDSGLVADGGSHDGGSLDEGSPVDASAPTPPAPTDAEVDASSLPAPGIVCGAATQEGATVVVPPSSLFDTADSCGSFTRATRIAELDENALAIVADSTDVYVATGTTSCSFPACWTSPGPLYRVPRCGGPAEILVPTDKIYAELVDGGTVLYYRTAEIVSGVTEVGRIRKADGVLEVLAELPAGTTYALAANSTHGYAMKGNGLYRIAHDSTSVELIATRDAVGCSEGSVSVDDSALAWSMDLTAWRAALDGSGAAAIFTSSSPIGAVAVAVDATYVGTLTDQNCQPADTGQVLRIPTAGGSPAVLDANAPDPTAMRVVGSLLYRSDTRDGLVRIATDGTGSRERILDSGSPGAISEDRLFTGTHA